MIKGKILPAINAETPIGILELTFNQIKDEKDLPAIQVFTEIFQYILALPVRYDAYIASIMPVLWPKVNQKFQDAAGNDFLLLVTRNHLLQTVIFLLQNGADFLHRNQAGRNALAEARWQVEATKKLIVLLEKIEKGDLQPADVDKLLGVVTDVSPEAKNTDLASPIPKITDKDKDKDKKAKTPQPRSIEYQAVCDFIQSATILAGQSREQYLIAGIKAYDALRSGKAREEAYALLEVNQRLVKLLHSVTAGLLETRAIKAASLVSVDQKLETKATGVSVSSVASANVVADEKAKLAAIPSATPGHTRTASLTPVILTVEQQRQRALINFDFLLTVLQPASPVLNEQVWAAIPVHMKNFLDHKNEQMLANAIKILRALCAFDEQELGHNALAMQAVKMAILDDDLRLKIIADKNINKIKLVCVLVISTEAFPDDEQLDDAYDTMLCNYNIFLDILQPSSEILLSKNGVFIWRKAQQWMGEVGSGDNVDNMSLVKLKILQRLCAFSSDVLGLRKTCLQAISMTFLDVALCRRIIADPKIDKAKLLLALTRGVAKFPNEQRFKDAHFFLGIQQAMTVAMAANRRNDAANALKPLRLITLDFNHPHNQYAKDLLKICSDQFAGNIEEKRHDDVMMEIKKSDSLSQDSQARLKVDCANGRLPEKTRVAAAIALLTFYKKSADEDALYYWIVRIFTQLPKLFTDGRIVTLLDLKAEADQNLIVYLLKILNSILKPVQERLASQKIIRESSPHVYDNCMVYLMTRELKDQNGLHGAGKQLQSDDSIIASQGMTNHENNKGCAAKIRRGMKAENTVDYDFIRNTALGRTTTSARPVAKSVASDNSTPAVLTRPASQTVSSPSSAAALKAPAKSGEAVSSHLNSGPPPVPSMAAHQLQQQPQPPTRVRASTVPVSSSSAPAVGSNHSAAAPPKELRSS